MCVKILVCVLSYLRPKYLHQTLSSFVQANRALFPDAMRMIVLDQCSSSETIAVLKEFERYIETVYTSEKNLGIGWGYSQLIELSKFHSAEYVLFLEDDWQCQVGLETYLDDIFSLFDIHPRVGSLRLRTIDDPIRTTNAVTDKAITTAQWRDRFLVGNYHYVFNPHVVRQAVADALIPLSGEYHAMQRYQTLDLQAAQLQDRMFIHIGEERAHGRLSRRSVPEPVIKHEKIPTTMSFVISIPLSEREL